METSEPKKVPKQISKKSTCSAIRVSFEIRKRVMMELAKINKKPHGRRVKLDALIAKLLLKISAQDVADLQEASLTGRDRMEQNYRAYCAKFGHITMDQFLALISEQSMPQLMKESEAKNKTAVST